MARGVNGMCPLGACWPWPMISSTCWRTASREMPMLSEGLGRDTLTLVDQAQEDVLGADVVVVEHPRLFLREHHNTTSAVGEPFEHGLHFRSYSPARAGWNETVAAPPDRHTGLRRACPGETAPHRANSTGTVRVTRPLYALGESRRRDRWTQADRCRRPRGPRVVPVGGRSGTGRRLVRALVRRVVAGAQVCGDPAARADRDSLLGGPAPDVGGVLGAPGDPAAGLRGVGTVTRRPAAIHGAKDSRSFSAFASERSTS